MNRWWSWRVIGDRELVGVWPGETWLQVADEVSTEIRLLFALGRGAAVPLQVAPLTEGAPDGFPR